MWKKLWKMWAEDPQLPFPTVALGDWNFVEDPMDRNSGVTERVPESFKRLKDLLRLHDGWRATFSDTRDYTCVQHRKDRQSDEMQDSYSRLDRICVDSQQFNNFRGWDIKHCPVKSDHRLVVTELTCRPDEQPGQGRWSMPLYLLKTRKFMSRVQSLARQLIIDVDGLENSERNPENNIQTLWAKFKVDVTAYGKYCSRFITNNTTRQIRSWKAQLHLVIHDDDLSREDRSLTTYLLEKKITDALRDQSEAKKAVSEARYDVEGETLRTTSWTRSAKGYHPKDSIYEFKVEDDLHSPIPHYETRPKHMAQMARVVMSLAWPEARKPAKPGPLRPGQARPDGRA